VGNYLPIDQVRPEIAEAYVQEVWVKAQKMLAGCKETCDENKVHSCCLFYILASAFLFPVLDWLSQSPYLLVNSVLLITWRIESVPLSVG
jgi:hypothetical protein